MKSGFAPILIVAILLIGTISIIGYKYFEKNSYDQKDFEISQLKEQLKVLREDLYQPPQSPSPTPVVIERLSVIDKSKINSQNTYTLRCWHSTSVEDNPYSKTLLSAVGNNEHLLDVCLNSELQKIVFLTDGNGISLRVYDLKSKELKTITDKIFTGGGTCGLNIYLWSKGEYFSYKENSIFYKVLFCDSLPNQFIEHIERIDLGDN